MMGRGLFAGAKMAKDRQKFRWSDRRYKKRMLKSRAKHEPHLLQEMVQLTSLTNTMKLWLKVSVDAWAVRTETYPESDTK